MSQETAKTVGEWATQQFGKPTPLAVVNRMLLEVLECQAECIAIFPNPDKIALELADTVIVAYHVAAVLGVDLEEYVDAKMLVNRNRVWKLNPDGTGQHVKEEART